jgi:hypothetical protein
MLEQPHIVHIVAFLLYSQLKVIFTRSAETLIISASSHVLSTSSGLGGKQCPSRANLNHDSYVSCYDFKWDVASTKRICIAASCFAHPIGSAWLPCQLTTAPEFIG